MSTGVKDRPKALTGAQARSSIYRRLGLRPELPVFESAEISEQVDELLHRPATSAALTALLSGAGVGVGGQVPLTALTLGQPGHEPVLNEHEAGLLSQGTLEIEYGMGTQMDEPARAFPASQMHHFVVRAALNLVASAAFYHYPETRPQLWNHVPGFAVIETSSPDHLLAQPVPFVLNNGGIVVPSTTLDCAAAVSEAVRRSTDARSLVDNLVEVGVQLVRRSPFPVVDPATFEHEPVRRGVLEGAMAHEGMHPMAHHGTMMGPRAWHPDSLLAAELTAARDGFELMIRAGRPASGLLALNIAFIAGGSFASTWTEDTRMLDYSLQQYSAAYKLFQLWASESSPPGSPALTEGQKQDFQFLPSPEEAVAWIHQALDRRAAHHEAP